MNETQSCNNSSSSWSKYLASCLECAPRGSPSSVLWTILESGMLEGQRDRRSECFGAASKREGPRSSNLSKSGGVKLSFSLVFIRLISFHSFSDCKLEIHLISLN